MSVRRILQLGNPIFRAVSAWVATHAEAEPVFADLRDTLHQFQQTHGFGRGISAVQIGLPKRLIYIELEGRAFQLRNPAYEFHSEEKSRLWDDCFSFPDHVVCLERSRQVRVQYDGEDEVRRVVAARDAFSELLQHELDHLDVVLAIDRDSFGTREEWRARHARAAAGSSA